MNTLRRITHILRPSSIFMDIKKILKLVNFNKIKQLMIRLYRNNLFLNISSKKWKKSDDKCWACSKQRESQLHLFGLCKKSTKN